MDNRIIQLALEALAKRKAAIDAEIAELKSTANKKSGGAPSKATAARQSQSERMKAYWARKRAEAAKPAARTQKPGSKSAAARKAISERMKAYWAKRKAAHGKAARKGKP